MTNADVAFAPLLPLWAVGGLLVLGLAAWAAARHAGQRPSPWRLAALLALTFCLAGPQWQERDHQAVPDTVVILADESPSQLLSGRLDQTRHLVSQVQADLARLPGLEVRVLSSTGGNKGETRLFDAARQAFAQIPPDRRAGLVLITDGQVHDLPQAAPSLGGPVHVLLTGSPHERDRRIRLDHPPGYGLVGEHVDLALTVLDAGQNGRVPVTFRRDDGTQMVHDLPLNQSVTLSLPITHAGPNLLEVDVPTVPGELTTVNNRTYLSVQGVRDRLRVLLISGEPNLSERSWRNLLKSDPSVDLVHFTILRPPGIVDPVPSDEMSLIPFPVAELFEDKLTRFDLVIFDRPLRRGLLPSPYYKGLKAYVEQGGAVMFALGEGGTETSGPPDPALLELMPARPTGHTETGAFIPGLAPDGQRHPVTQGLERPDMWGPWVRRMDVRETEGNILLQSPNGQPLLVTRHLGKGRVALILSDSLWMWGRSIQGGGPLLDLLRRLSHWLMKEPDLDEEALTVQLVQDQAVVTKQSLGPLPATLTVRSPQDEQSQVPLNGTKPGQGQARFAVPSPGLWRISDGTRTITLAAGLPHGPEMADLTSTPNLLAPLVKESGGFMGWAADGLPQWRRTAPGRISAGRDWAGLVANGTTIIRDQRQIALIPPPLALILVVGLTILAWWREGRS